MARRSITAARSDEDVVPFEVDVVDEDHEYLSDSWSGFELGSFEAAGILPFPLIRRTERPVLFANKHLRR
jgi:hypothetical protein